MHLVPARDYVAYAELAAPVGDRVVRSIQRNHHRAHLGVNVAEDVRDARFVELHKLRASTLIQAEIEALAVEQREDIVKKRIAIRELDLASRWNHQQRRMEHLLLLNQLGDLRCLLRGRRRRWGGPKRREPHHNLRSITHVTLVSCELHLALQFNILPHGNDTREHQDAPQIPSVSEAKHVQNSIPIARLIWFVVLALL